jgi:hypothetical protein
MTGPDKAGNERTRLRPLRTVALWCAVALMIQAILGAMYLTAWAVSDGLAPGAMD